MSRAVSSVGVTITDPLVKYHSLLAAGLCSPDAAQHRLAIHLQRIYHRLKDYSPAVEYGARLRAVANILERQRPRKAGGDGGDGRTLAVEMHPIRRNPLFARFLARTEGRESMALTRTLGSDEEAIGIDSPRGLFVSGEVGVGKSMLLDLLADGLPTSRKRRWHFNTFMLHTLSQLERHRTSRSGPDSDDGQHSLLWMAKQMIDTSPILFLDEFQLPDRAASKILSNLFTAFFQLGGVLIASSNRVPEELEKATGHAYGRPAVGGLVGQMLGLGQSRGIGELSGSSSDFATFLKVLKARCEFWQMEGGKDWRRREAGDASRLSTVADASPSAPAGDGMEYTGTEIDAPDRQETGRHVCAPRHFYLSGETDDMSWRTIIDSLVPSSETTDPWTSATLTIYGRTVTIPRQSDGVAYWDFVDLVSCYGPADYITMASTFHTFVIDAVPVLDLLKKNEARRLITLLDALYEARCKLIVRSEVAGPDHLFFPDRNAATRRTAGQPQDPLVDADVTYSETVAEVYQDQTSPFRPNISTYTDADPDQDPDFATAPSRPDFTDTGAFTGEDERFAYKRAASRLWELCGARWHARTGDWWRPLPPEARHWEGGPATKPPASTLAPAAASGDATMGPAVELDALAGLQGLRVRDLKKAVLEGDQAEEGEGAKKER